MERKWYGLLTRFLKARGLGPRGKSTTILCVYWFGAQWCSIHMSAVDAATLAFW